MGKLKSEIYRMKAFMIREREMFMTPKELLNKEYFPRYLILRRPLGFLNKQNDGWEGFVKDIKKSVKEN